MAGIFKTNHSFLVDAMVVTMMRVSSNSKGVMSHVIQEDSGR